MISEIRKIPFKEFIRDYRMLDSKDKVWLLSLIHSSQTLEYFKIINIENNCVGIGSMSCVELMKEVSFAIFTSHKRKGYGSCFIEFTKRDFPGACFKVSQFNIHSMSLFQRSEKKLNLKCSRNNSTYTFFS